MQVGSRSSETKSNFSRTTQLHADLPSAIIKFALKDLVQKVTKCEIIMIDCFRNSNWEGLWSYWGIEESQRNRQRKACPDQCYSQIGLRFPWGLSVHVIWHQTTQETELFWFWSSIHLNFDQSATAETGQESGCGEQLTPVFWCELRPQTNWTTLFWRSNFLNIYIQKMILQTCMYLLM